MNEELRVFLADDVAAMLGVSKTHAYKIIKKLNYELEEKGYITTPGRIPKAYFEERCYLNGSGRTIKGKNLLS